MSADRMTAVAVALGAAASLASLATGAELSVNRYDHGHGLSGQPVTALAQDHAGRLWVGSLGGGVSRFDGYRWRQFTSRDGLLSDRVVALTAGAHGEMWLATAAADGGRAGLTVVRGDAVVSTIAGADWQVATGLVTSAGEVWFGFAGGGGARFDGTTLEPVPELDAVRVTEIVESPDGALWFRGRALVGGPIAAGVLTRLRAGIFRHYGVADGLPRAPFHDLLCDPDGQVWVATASGLYGSRAGRFAAGDAATARPIHSLSLDRDGRLWLGAVGAVIWIEDGVATELTLPADLGPVPVLEVAASPQGGVFARTPATLLRLEGHAAEVRALPERASLLPVGSGVDPLAWEAAFDELVDGNPSLLIDSEGSLWSLEGRGVIRYLGDEARRFDVASGLPSAEVRSVMLDSRGQLWAGTARGVARFDDQLGYFQPLTGSTDAVVAMFEDRGGNVYLGTACCVLRAAELTVVPWAPAEGLAGIRAFAADSTGALWIGGDAGVARVAVDGLELLTAADGLAETAVLALASGADALWVGHPGGLTRGTTDGYAPVAAFAGVRVLALLASPSPADPPVAVTPGGLMEVPSGRWLRPSTSGSRLHAAFASDDGTRWLGLDVGLLKVVAGAESLLAGGSFPTAPAVALAADLAGAMWLGTADGLYRHTPRRAGPSIQMTAVAAVLPSSDGSLRLRAGDGDVAIELDAVSFLGPRGSAEVRFETRLLPREPRFGPGELARERHLLDLAPGAYVFEAQSVSRELVTSPPAQLRILVGDDGDAVDEIEALAASGAAGDGDPATTRPARAPPPRQRVLVLPDIARP